MRRGFGCGLVALGVAMAGCGDGAQAGRREGGVLRVIGSSDLERLDTAAAASVGSYALNRTYARTLFGTRASNDFATSVALHPDVAERLPSRGNGDVSPDGKTYRIRLRPGVRWDTSPPREVVAGDFVRGLKRLCNPAAPSSGKGYYISTVQGMAEYCRGFAGVDATDAAAIAGYQNRTPLPGLAAPDDRTLVVRLVRPAGDLLNLLALGYAAAAPREYDTYVPDSLEFRRNTVSNGPYRISAYNPGRSYLLGHNPAWRPETDPLRERHVAKIQITLGQDSAHTVQQQLEQGAADLAWDQPVPTPALPRLRRDPGFAIRRTPSSSPYLVFNTLSPNNKGSLGRPEVRRAIQYAIDRTALVKIYGGPEVARPLHTIIPPGNAGHVHYDLYPTPGDAGDPAKCRALLAGAGYPGGLTLRFPYRTNGNHRRVAESIKENLRGCGIDARLAADTNGDFYGRTLAVPERARAGAWDIAAPGWTPDWYGDNGRSIIQPLFDGRDYGHNSLNFGGYDNPQVNGLIDKALAATDPAERARLWHQTDRLIMEDAAIVPLLDRSYTIYRSRRVRNARFLPVAMSYDYTLIWLAGGR
ncbi:ABC transporter substrate-binding protein [Actinomadura craniellae]|uniref:ABC transporter substrate-binding protein n=1 Tax=Actinomadura craniellae TaxID=2231787 RepID=A0A365H6K0_9ACTN|nr:ABC transporter substrate-binding protein [Actinomadura craniellae]RAY14735.1 ABC transporter substrate-binding protein [Actinomadura craniellae]